MPTLVKAESLSFTNDAMRSGQVLYTIHVGSLVPRPAPFFDYKKEKLQAFLRVVVVATFLRVTEKVRAWERGYTLASVQDWPTLE